MEIRQTGTYTGQGLEKIRKSEVTSSDVMERIIAQDSFKKSEEAEKGTYSREDLAGKVKSEISGESKKTTSVQLAKDTWTNENTSVYVINSDIYTDGVAKEPTFINFPKDPNKPANYPELGRVLSDIESHLPKQYGSSYQDPDRITWGHETTHGINSHLRNHYNNTGKEANGFYCTENRAIVLPEPGIRKSSVGKYVPDSLKGSRYQMYIIGQTAFEHQPLYIFDEWTSYTNGADVGVNLVNEGKWKWGWRDAVAGAVEFTAYSFALGMALEKQDPKYLENNPNFKEFLAWQAIRSMDIFREGAQMPQFKYAVQDKYYENFKYSPDAQPMRDYIRRNFGEEYLQRMLYGKS